MMLLRYLGSCGKGIDKYDILIGGNTVGKTIVFSGQLSTSNQTRG